MTDAILVLNAGSSSIKFSLFADGARRARAGRCAGRSKAIYTSPRFVAKDAAGKHGRREALGRRRRSSGTTARSSTSSTGCRPARRATTASPRSATAWCTAASSTRRRCASMPRVVAAAREAGSARAAAPAAQPRADPRAARALAGRCRRSRASTPRSTAPTRRWRRRSRCRRSSPTRGVRRYGFHGLSYEYIASVLPRFDAARGAGQDGRAAPRQRRQHVRDRRPAAASRARWASPPSTACRWARAAARSIPA